MLDNPNNTVRANELDKKFNQSIKLKMLISKSKNFNFNKDVDHKIKIMSSSPSSNTTLSGLRSSPSKRKSVHNNNSFMFLIENGGKASGLSGLNSGTGTFEQSENKASKAVL